MSGISGPFYVLGPSEGHYGKVGNDKPRNERIVTNVDVKDFERWRSAIEGQIWIKQFDRNGTLKSIPIYGGREFNILPEERRMMQENCAEVKLDPFQNGHLIPVRLVEHADDYEELKGNPNHLTEEDMRGLLDDPKTIDALVQGVSQVKNPTTLVRLLAIAEDPQEDCTVRQVAVIRERLQAIQEQSDYEEVETLGYAYSQTSDGRDVLVTRAPRNDTPPNPSAGRREGRGSGYDR